MTAAIKILREERKDLGMRVRWLVGEGYVEYESKKGTEVTLLVKLVTLE